MDTVSKKIEAFKKSARPSLVEHLEIEFLEMSQDKIVASMPVCTKTMQPFGFLHGGASVALAETVASVGAWLNINAETEQTFGMEINANHLRAVSEGKVTATATPIHKGKSSQIWDIRIHDHNSQLICVSRCTLAVLPIRTIQSLH